MIRIRTKGDHVDTIHAAKKLDGSFVNDFLQKEKVSESVSVAILERIIKGEVDFQVVEVNSVDFQKLKCVEDDANRLVKKCKSLPKDILSRLGIEDPNNFVPFKVEEVDGGVAFSVRFLVRSNVGFYSLVEEAPVLHGSWFKVAQAAFNTMSLSLPPVRASLVHSALTSSEKCRVKLFTLAVGAIAHKGFLLRIAKAGSLDPNETIPKERRVETTPGNNVVALSVAENGGFFSISEVSFNRGSPADPLKHAERGLLESNIHRSERTVFSLLQPCDSCSGAISMTERIGDVFLFV